MKILFITGAGISVSAGLHTYRGQNGLYSSIEDRFGLPVERLLTPNTLKNNPELFWAYWSSFLDNLKGVKPGVCQQSIALMAQVCDGFLELTQNVDGLSRQAGLKDDQLIELHGRADVVECMRCRTQVAPPNDFDRVPYCASCGPKLKGLLRPCVTLFSENLSRKAIMRGHEFLAQADLLVVVGTTIQFDYLVFLITEAIRQSIPVVYVDPNASPFAGALLTADFDTDLVGGIIPIRQGAERVLPMLLEEFKVCQAEGVGREQMKERMTTFKERVDTTCA
jgi:NAD-dependent deacetylase